MESFVLLDLAIQPNVNEACHIHHIKEACHIDQDVDALFILLYFTCPIFFFFFVLRCNPICTFA